MDLLAPLRARLARVIAGSERAMAPDTLTIDELFRQLLPYADLRAELGATEIAWYDLAMLRLIAGEGGAVEVEDPSVRDLLRASLLGPAVDVGVYRRHPDARVRLIPMDSNGEAVLGTGSVSDLAIEESGTLSEPAGASTALTGDSPALLAEPVPVTEATPLVEVDLPGDSPAPTPLLPEPDPPRPTVGAVGLLTPAHPAPSGDSPVPLVEPVPATESSPVIEVASPASFAAQTPVTAPAPPRLPAGAGGAPTPPYSDSAAITPPAAAGRSCGRCRRDLPEIAGLRFCPFCGSAKRTRSCSACGTELQGGWGICIQCGVNWTA